MNGAHTLTVKLSDVSIVLYPGEQNMMIGTFTQETSFGKSLSVTRKLQ